MHQDNEWGISPDEVQVQTSVLKEGQMFITSLPSGEIPHQETGELGLYYRDTRFLSCHEIFLEGARPILLSSTTRDSHFAQIELANRETVSGQMVIPLHTVHLRILRVVQNSLVQRFRFINFNNFPITVSLKIVLGADFADIFEVRGVKRGRRGEIKEPVVKRNGIAFSYLGLDGRLRRTQVWFSRQPHAMSVDGGLATVEFSIPLPTREKVYLYMMIRPVVDETGGKKKEDCRLPRFAAVFNKLARDLWDDYNRWKEECTEFYTDNEVLNRMIQTGITDLRALRAEYPGWGKIVEAGIPWYSAPFGRDSLITSWQTLILNPVIARDTLRFLAKLQGREENKWREEKPGKILHEIRFGEMALANEVPHSPYYGSVDATPLFIVLLAEYFRWMDDRPFLEEMAGPLDRALEWCRRYGDMDGDGYLEYLRESERGLVNQGWKDSWDAVVDREGVIPQGPIALVEVQAYYYLALVRAAGLYRVLGREKEARYLEKEADQLQQRFIRDFWVEEEEYPAFALDGNKRRVICTVSNPGHCLFTGILPGDKAALVVKRLFQPDMYNGWGIRTMSSRESAYNPMSYHNGSVWPHDNVIIARGLRRYGFFKELARMADGLYQAALHFPYHRLPELFCGFTRRGLAGPVRYPTACDPQAWAVGSIFQLLQTLLGIEGRGRDVHITRPILPGWLGEVVLKNMRVGGGRVDLEFSRRGGKTYCSVLRREGNVRVVVEP